MRLSRRSAHRAQLRLARIASVWLLAVGSGCARETAETTAASVAVAEASADGSGDGSGAVVYGVAAPAVGGFPAVVTLEPADVAVGVRGGRAPLPAGLSPAAADSPAAAGASASSVFMDQIGMAFYPPTLLTRVGQTVEFLNSEAVMHNVNVANDDGGVTLFNVATPPGFAAYEHAFTEPGVYRVTCDVHPAMSAFIVAVATPHAAVADRDGRFQIAGVPAGSYTASVWSLDAARQLRRAVEISAGSVELDLRADELAD